MKFFGPNDFSIITADYSEEQTHEYAADIANSKLEREGKVVHSIDSENHWNIQRYGTDKYKALLINIELIGVCTHPVTKLTQSTLGLFLCDCECGAKLEPLTFGEVK